jgi:Mrp family chromosome partitioning ATPase
MRGDHAVGEIADALRRARELAKTGRGENPRVDRFVEGERERPAERPNPAVLEGAGPRSAAGPRRQSVRDAPELAGLRQRIERLSPPSAAVQVDDGSAVQACRQLAVRVREELSRRGARTLAVVSAVRGEGKTTILCNLGIAMATLSQGGRVAVLDLDLRSPSVGRALGLSPSLGVDDYLRRGVRLEEVGIACEDRPLDVYAVARPHENAHELLVTPRFEELISDLVNRYSMVLIDTPPTLVVPDVSLMLSYVDACIPVARCGVSRVGSFRQLLDTLPDRKVLGEVLNEGHLASYAAYPYTYGDDGTAQPEDDREEEAGAAPDRSSWRLRRRSS